jgi:hypothetical protein
MTAFWIKIWLDLQYIIIYTAAEIENNFNNMQLFCRARTASSRNIFLAGAEAA